MGTRPLFMDWLAPAGEALVRRVPVMKPPVGVTVMPAVQPPVMSAVLKPRTGPKVMALVFQVAAAVDSGMMPWEIPGGKARVPPPFTAEMRVRRQGGGREHEQS